MHCARLNRPVVAIAAVTLLAAGLRIVHLSHPVGYVFDEVYYPKAACILLGWSDETCTIDPGDEHYWREKKWDVGSWVHPPLGKWEIAMGIKAFGMNEFGWRVVLGRRRHRCRHADGGHGATAVRLGHSGPRSPAC